MNRDQTVYFTCPNCDERFARVEELDRDIHTAEIYHCSSCGIQVIFQAVSAEDYVPPPRARRDCRFCNPEPLYGQGRTTDNLQTTQRKERRHETCSTIQRGLLPHAAQGR